jgi:hypothetical protein
MTSRNSCSAPSPPLKLPVAPSDSAHTELTAQGFRPQRSWPCRLETRRAGRVPSIPLHQPHLQPAVLLPGRVMGREEEMGGGASAGRSSSAADRSHEQSAARQPRCRPARAHGTRRVRAPLPRDPRARPAGRLPQRLRESGAGPPPPGRARARTRRFCKRRRERPPARRDPPPPPRTLALALARAKEPVPTAAPPAPPRSGPRGAPLRRLCAGQRASRRGV